MSLISILVVFTFLIYVIRLIPTRSSFTKFYVLGVIIYYPIYWLIALLLAEDGVSVTYPVLISIFLIAHTVIFVLTAALLWSFLGLEDRFAYAKNQVQRGDFDWLLFPMALVVYGITIYRVYAYGFLVAGVTPVAGFKVYAELPYWDTILLSFQGIMFPLMIIWPVLRLSFLRENPSSNVGTLQFRLLVMMAFLLSVSFGRSAVVSFLVFVFLFSTSLSLISLKSLVKKASTGLLIMLIVAPSFYTLRQTLNDEFGGLKMISNDMLSNVGARASDIISFTDEILISNKVGINGPYLLNSYKRLIPSFLLENCTSYNCPAKVPLEKAVLHSMNQRDTDKPETFFIATLVDKSLITFVFYPLALGFLMALELFFIAKITNRNSIYFMLAYCHIGYSLVKIEADSAWFLFHIRDCMLLFALLYFFSGGLKTLSRMSFYNRHSQ